MIVFAVSWLPAIRVPFGLLLTFVLPGYIVSLALFPQRTLGVTERVAVALGLSLIIGALGGFLLNATPWGLETGSWVLFLAAITLIAGFAAWLRRGDRPTEADAHRASAIALHQGLLVGLAVVVMLSAVALSSTGASRQQSNGFTQLWLLPAAEAKPTLHIGIRSYEPAVTEFLLRLEADGHVIQEWSPLTVRPKEQWETTAVLPASVSGNGTVEAVLYRVNDPTTVYRRVVLAL